MAAPASSLEESLQTLRNQIPIWDAVQDELLLQTVKRLHKSVLQRATAVEGRVGCLARRMDDTDVRLRAVFSRLGALSTRQFVEHRINNADGTCDQPVPLGSSSSVAPTLSDVENIQRALALGRQHVEAQQQRRQQQQQPWGALPPIVGSESFFRAHQHMEAPSSIVSVESRSNDNLNSLMLGTTSNDGTFSEAGVRADAADKFNAVAALSSETHARAVEAPLVSPDADSHIVMTSESALADRKPTQVQRDCLSTVDMDSVVAAEVPVAGAVFQPNFLDSLKLAVINRQPARDGAEPQVSNLEPLRANGPASMTKHPSSSPRSLFDKTAPSRKATVQAPKKPTTTSLFDGDDDLTTSSDPFLAQAPSGSKKAVVQAPRKPTTTSLFDGDDDVSAYSDPLLAQASSGSKKAVVQASKKPTSTSLFDSGDEVSASSDPLLEQAPSGSKKAMVQAPRKPATTSLFDGGDDFPASCDPLQASSGSKKATVQAPRKPTTTSLFDGDDNVSASSDPLQASGSKTATVQAPRKPKTTSLFDGGDDLQASSDPLQASSGSKTVTVNPLQASSGSKVATIQAPRKPTTTTSLFDGDDDLPASSHPLPAPVGSKKAMVQTTRKPMTAVLFGGDDDLAASSNALPAPLGGKKAALQAPGKRMTTSVFDDDDIPASSARLPAPSGSKKTMVQPPKKPTTTSLFDDNIDTPSTDCHEPTAEAPSQKLDSLFGAGDNPSTQPDAAGGKLRTGKLLSSLFDDESPVGIFPMKADSAASCSQEDQHVLRARSCASPEVSHPLSFGKPSAQATSAKQDSSHQDDRRTGIQPKDSGPLATDVQRMPPSNFTLPGSFSAVGPPASSDSHPLGSSFSAAVGKTNADTGGSAAVVKQNMSTCVDPLSRTSPSAAIAGGEPSRPSTSGTAHVYHVPVEASAPKKMAMSQMPPDVEATRGLLFGEAMQHSNDPIAPSSSERNRPSKSRDSESRRSLFDDSSSKQNSHLQQLFGDDTEIKPSGSGVSSVLFGKEASASSEPLTEAGCRGESVGQAPPNSGESCAVSQACKSLFGDELVGSSASLFETPPLQSGWVQGLHSHERKSRSATASQSGPPLVGRLPLSRNPANDSEDILALEAGAGSRAQSLTVPELEASKTADGKDATSLLSTISQVPSRDSDQEWNLDVPDNGLAFPTIAEEQSALPRQDMMHDEALPPVVPTADETTRLPTPAPEAKDALSAIKTKLARDESEAEDSDSSGGW